MIHEQSIPYQCPECYTLMTIRNIIREDDYPIGGYRNSMKPYTMRALIFECPECFELSCCHADKGMLETYKIWREECEEKKRENRND